MICLPADNPHDIAKLLTIEDAYASVVTSNAILNLQKEPEYPWENGLLARYALILMKVLEDGGHTKLLRMKPRIIKHLRGADWYRPNWLTDEVIEEHKQRLKWLDVVRHIQKRCQKLTGKKFDTWRERYQLPPALHCSEWQIEQAHKVLDRINNDRMEYMLHYQELP